MGLRLSFGVGPLRASIPLTGRRRRRRRSTARARARTPTFHGTVRLPDGSAYTCHHAHRTEQAAIECAAKYKRTITPQAPTPTRPRKKASMGPNDPGTQVSNSPRWWPRAGWGTVRGYRMKNRDNGNVDLSFKFVPDDGSEPRWIRITDTAPMNELGEYARGLMQGDHVTINVPPESMAEAEGIFQRINQMELSKRKSLFTNRSDLAGDCGWTWTSDYTVVKVAPGLF